MTLPPINPSFNIETPFKYLKHIEKLDTSTFPDCHSVEREWKIKERNLVYVHHSASCHWEVMRVYILEGQLKMEKL